MNDERAPCLDVVDVGGSQEAFESSSFESHPQSVPVVARPSPAMSIQFLAREEEVAVSAVSVSRALSGRRQEPKLTLVALKLACALTLKVFHRLVKGEVLTKEDKTPVTGETSRLPIEFWPTCSLTRDRRDQSRTFRHRLSSPFFFSHRSLPSR